VAQELSHRFVVRIREEVCTFNRWEDIPPVLDHVIAFLPAIPPPPHTEQQHAEIDAWYGRLQELMERERASRHKDR
jgi:hypothetical protein